ncbi:hypothetical protein FP2506_15054 [Fulvimarina pelagi HTCC2506]|uniref:Uncharacterized protein n=1 Tax=Fulvimarina pelagi HTCC2506 TaxID=314231 RepID=Q0G3R9_9HYPH|nr:hypothetical protein FP2506_15054 [Fulvimarina pelagi HTCC2506]
MQTDMTSSFRRPNEGQPAVRLEIVIVPDMFLWIPEATERVKNAYNSKFS